MRGGNTCLRARMCVVYVCVWGMRVGGGGGHQLGSACEEHACAVRWQFHEANHEANCQRAARESRREYIMGDIAGSNGYRTPPRPSLSWTPPQPCRAQPITPTRHGDASRLCNLSKWMYKENSSRCV